MVVLSSNSWDVETAVYLLLQNLEILSTLPLFGRWLADVFRITVILEGPTTFHPQTSH